MERIPNPSAAPAPLLAHRCLKAHDLDGLFTVIESIRNSSAITTDAGMYMVSKDLYSAGDGMRVLQMCPVWLNSCAIGPRSKTCRTWMMIDGYGDTVRAWVVEYCGRGVERMWTDRMTQRRPWDEGTKKRQRSKLGIEDNARLEKNIRITRSGKIQR